MVTVVASDMRNIQISERDHLLYVQVGTIIFNSIDFFSATIGGTQH